MAIVSLLILIGAPRFSAIVDSTRLKLDGRQMVRVLQTARQEAISTGQSKTVYFYPLSTKYNVLGGATYWLSPGITYVGETNFSKHQGKHACIFSPSGAPSSAGTVTIKNKQGKKLYIIVSVAAGRVRLSEQPPPSWE